MTWYFVGFAGIALALFALADGVDPILAVIAAGMIFASYKLWEHEESPRR